MRPCLKLIVSTQSGSSTLENVEMRPGLADALRYPC